MTSKGLFRKRNRTALIAVGLTAVGLGMAGCSGGKVLGDVTWSAPLNLTHEQYAATNALPITSGDGIAVVNLHEENGWILRAFDTSTDRGKKLWEIPLEPVDCTVAVDLVYCIPLEAGGTPTVISAETGESAPMPHFGGLAAVTDSDFVFERRTDDAVELVAIAHKTPLAKMPTAGEPIATIDLASGKLSGGKQLTGLQEAKQLDQNSSWSGTTPPTARAQAISDGWVDLNTYTEGKATYTLVAVYADADNSEETFIYPASTHTTVNPEWTADDARKIFTKAKEQAETTPHVLIFQDGHVLGMDRMLSTDVAPAFAYVQSLELSNGASLKTEVDADSMVLWVYEYPFIAVSGTRGTEVFARTYTVDGAVVVTDKKCQWTEGETYCFDTDKVESVDLAGRNRS